MVAKDLSCILCEPSYDNLTPLGSQEQHIDRQMARRMTWLRRAIIAAMAIVATIAALNALSAFITG
jgi:hypothetical protein